MHIVQFLDMHSHFKKGLGWWSEQASESVHADFEKLWLRYKRNMNHPEYRRQLFKCCVTYNARHYGD